MRIGRHVLVLERRPTRPAAHAVVTAVLAIALFLITLVLTLAQQRYLERRVHYAR